VPLNGPGTLVWYSKHGAQARYPTCEPNCVLPACSCLARLQLMDQLLLPAPRKVAKVDLTYDKAAKQV